MTYSFTETDGKTIMEIFSTVRTHVSNELIVQMTHEFEHDQDKNAFLNFVEYFALMKKLFNLYNNIYKFFIIKENKLVKYPFTNQIVEDLKIFYEKSRTLQWHLIEPRQSTPIFFDKNVHIISLLKFVPNLYNTILIVYKDFNFASILPNMPSLSFFIPKAKIGEVKKEKKRRKN